MIYIDIVSNHYISSLALCSSSSKAKIRALECSRMRRNIGQEIKQWLPFGIKPTGKLHYSSCDSFEEYDGEEHHMQVVMKGTFFQFLHAFRAGLKIYRSQLVWGD